MVGQCITSHWILYPPTPADARGSAPGNKTFDSCRTTTTTTTTTTTGTTGTGTTTTAAAYSRSRAAGRTCLTQFFSGFRRAGRPCLTQFSTVSDDTDDTLGSFWATFCRHGVFPSGRPAAPAPAASPPPRPPPPPAAAAGPAAELVLIRIQKGRQAPGQHVFGSRSILAWCFGVARGTLWRPAAAAASGPAAAAGPAAAPPPPAGAAAGPAAAGPAAELALFLSESRRDVKPRGSMVFGGRSVLQ